MTELETSAETVGVTPHGLERVAELLIEAGVTEISPAMDQRLILLCLFADKMAEKGERPRDWATAVIVAAARGEEPPSWHEWEAKGE